MLKKINALALATRLQALRPSKQALLHHLKQGGIAVIAFGSLYVIAPPLWNAISVSPQQRVEPLDRRINDLDKQIRVTKSPSTTDLKEIATLEKGRIDSENTIRTSLFQAVGGLLVFVTLGISWLTLKSNEAKQVAERFSKAVEQLGNDNIHVRLGGTYALEQIAKDAEEKYYWQVMETLTSYVREQSPYPPKAAKPHSSFVQTALETAASNETQDEAIPPLPVDIQAAMTVIARRKHSYGHPLEPHPLDLHGADLRRLQLPSKTQLKQVNFAGVNFAGTNLQEVDLHEINLQKADLSKANLKGANLWRVNLKNANLGHADLRGARLGHANLQDASLNDANLQQVNLEFANLQEALLAQATLQSSKLYAADLRGANLTYTQLPEAMLIKADLQGAKLFKANLRNTSCGDIKLQGANLEFADFSGARNLDFKEVQKALFYERAMLPNYPSPQTQQLNTETARSIKQATEAVQVRGETTATTEETQ